MTGTGAVVWPLRATMRRYCEHSTRIGKTNFPVGVKLAHCSLGARRRFSLQSKLAATGPKFMLRYFWQNRCRAPLFSVAFLRLWTKRLLTFPALLSTQFRRWLLVRRGASIGQDSC